MWTKKIKANIFAVPLATKEALFIGSAQDYIFYALERNSGNTLWSFNTEGGIDSSPKCFQDSVFFGCNDNKLYSLDIKSGQIKFKFNTGSSIKASPVISDSFLIFGSWDKNIYSISQNSGELLWRQEVGDWIQIPPVIFDDVVYLSDMGGYVYALEINTGTRIWVYKSFDRAEGKLHIEEETLIITNQTNKITAIDIMSGEEIWSHNSLYTISLRPFIDEKKVIYGDSSGKIITLELASGNKILEKSIGEVLIGSAGVSNKNYFICNGENGSIFVVDSDTLQISKSYKLPVKSYSKPLKLQSDLVVIADDGSLNYFDNFFEQQKADSQKLSSQNIQNVAKKVTSSNVIGKSKPKTESNFKKPAAKDMKIISPMENAVQQLKTATLNIGSHLIEKEFGYSVFIKGHYNQDKEIYILTKTQDCEGEPYLQIITPLYPAVPEKYLPSLRQSSLLSYGSLAIKKIGSNELIVLSETQLAESADAAELQAMLTSLALRGEDLQTSKVFAQKKLFLHDSEPQLMIGKKLLKQTQEIIDFQFADAPRGFEISVGDKSEQVKISLLLDKTDAGGNYMITFVTLCGELKKQEEAYQLLVVNGKVPYGGFGLIKNKNQFLVVMTDTRILSHTQPVEIRKSLISIYNAVVSYRSNKN